MKKELDWVDLLVMFLNGMTVGLLLANLMR